MKQLSVSYRKHERGITSFFAVIFAATLLTMIVVSFAALMIREEARSSDSELSQSAYDAALAGVEDAKRVLVLSRGTGAEATAARSAISSGQCDTVAQAGVAGIPGQETPVQSSTTGEGSELQQAYTCVVINTMSDDILISDLLPMQSQLVPLTSAGDFSKVVIEWHNAVTSTSNPCAPSGPTATPLCLYNSWGTAAEVPALVRAQFIVPNNLNDLSSLETAQSGNSVFLYPKPFAATGSTADLSASPRFVDGNGENGTANNVRLVRCSTALVVEYRCSVIIDMPRNITVAESQSALLRLSSIYKDTPSVRISLLDSSNNPVQFNGAQPVVDSTGRANDLFRRVEARLSLATDLRYPEFAVDTNGAFCKNFWVVPSGSPGATVGQITPACQP